MEKKPFFPYIKYTWGHDKLGFTLESMARTKAAVFPVPDWDWAIMFYNKGNINESWTMLASNKFETLNWLIDWNKIIWSEFVRLKSEVDN